MEKNVRSQLLEAQQRARGERGTYAGFDILNEAIDMALQSSDLELIKALARVRDAAQYRVGDVRVQNRLDNIWSIANLAIENSAAPAEGWPAILADLERDAKQPLGTGTSEALRVAATRARDALRVGGIFPVKGLIYQALDEALAGQGGIGSEVVSLAERHEPGSGDSTSHTARNCGTELACTVDRGSSAPLPHPSPVANTSETQMNEREQFVEHMLKTMVDRFLAWPLPKDFAPDCGISFDGRKDDEWNKNKTWPVGTNLFTAEQALAMFKYALRGDDFDGFMAAMNKPLVAGDGKP